MRPAGDVAENWHSAQPLHKTARALGADEDEAAFKEKLAVIARQKPQLDEDKKDER